MRVMRGGDAVRRGRCFGVAFYKNNRVRYERGRLVAVVVFFCTLDEGNNELFDSCFNMAFTKSEIRVGGVNTRTRLRKEIKTSYTTFFFAR